jgi:RecA/RadA recombinase
VKSICQSQCDSSQVLKKIAVGQVLGLEDVIEKVELLRKFEKVSLVVLDNLTAALNLSGDPGSRSRQRKLFGALDSIRRVINDIDTHVMITDHSSRNWVSGQATPIGGNVLSHAVDSVIRVDRLRKGQDVVRILVERCTLPSPPPGVILRAGSKGIRSIR